MAIDKTNWRRELKNIRDEVRELKDELSQLRADYHEDFQTITELLRIIAANQMLTNVESELATTTPEKISDNEKTVEEIVALKKDFS